MVPYCRVRLAFALNPPYTDRDYETRFDLGCQFCKFL